MCDVSAYGHGLASTHSLPLSPSPVLLPFGFLRVRIYFYTFLLILGSQ